MWNQEHEETKGGGGPDEFMMAVSEYPKLPLWILLHGKCNLQLIVLIL